MLKRDDTIYTHETDIAVLGAGAAGCGVALGAREADRRVLLVDKGKLESCGCVGGGNDHFMGILNSGDPCDTVDEMVKFFAKPNSGFLPETVRQWGEAMPHLITFLESIGLEFRRNEKGGYMRTNGFAQPGNWWMLIRNGTFIKPLLSRKLREMGADVLEHVLITRLLTHNGHFAGAVGYHVLNGSIHVIRAKTGVLAMGLRPGRAYTNSTQNPFNTQTTPFNTGSQFVLAYEAGARVAGLSSQQGATVLPKSFGCAGLNGMTGAGAFALNARLERFMLDKHPMAEMGPRNLMVREMKRQCETIGAPVFLDMRHINDRDRDILEFELMPGDKATWPEYSAQKGVNFKDSLLEVETSDIMLGGTVLRDETFESSLPGLFVGSGFASFSGAFCGGYCASRHAARKAAEMKSGFPLDMDIVLQEQKSILAPLDSGGGTDCRLFEKAIQQVMDYYMGFVRNETGMKTALAGLDRIAALEGDLYAENWHDLLRIHEAKHLLKLCRLAVLASLDDRQTTPGRIYARSDYPDPDPALQGVQYVEKNNGSPVFRRLRM